ncbi:hypothetical protein GOBAR_AA25790 [Gossypium barbadense]|uniref:FBD domain-containing protein n=1 Tax=Gossypium barbadense TaxID=3634 RepID=A0A2P5WUY1_GOSBA|nr:hypothetical protein GOBAR_AA25790 [Gossypium barbadense]
MAFSLDSGPYSRLPANNQLLYRQKKSNILPAFGLQSFDAQQGGFSTQVSPHLQHRSRPFISQHYDQRRNPPERGSGSGHLDFREMEIRFLRTADLFILGREFVLKLSQGIFIDVLNYRSVRLLSLKVLHLKSVTYANNKSVSKLLQGRTMLEELIALRKDEAFPLFPNLTQLELNFGFDGRNLTPYFLENSHALEVLVLRPDTRTRIKDPESLPPQLREVYVRGFSGLHHELEMVEYLLKNSRALELIEISHYRLHRQSMSSVLLKLSKFPRRSHACKVAFI